MSQLALDVDPPLHFVARAKDGRVVDVIPVQYDLYGIKAWHVAAQWALVAIANDERDQTLRSTTVA